MRDLKCSIKICAFNQGYSCGAKEITVNDTAICSSYTKDHSKKDNKMFELGLDETKPDYSVDTRVNCTAPCIFQKNRKCVAVGITVLSEKLKAECATFVLK